MYVVRGNAGVEKRDAEFTNPLPEHPPVDRSIFLELQQKFAVMTAMGEMIGVTRNDISFSARHRTRVRETQ